MNRTLANGRFQVNVDPIAAGQMGFVYQGYDRTRDCQIAIKRLIRRSPEHLYRLKQEFRSLSSIIHPNLVELYDLIDPAILEHPVEDDREFGPFIAMELIDGINLLDYVRGNGGSSDDGHLSEAGVSRLIRCLRQIIDGLEYLHQSGRVHRDIKPENVFIDESDRLVIIDFGLSHAFKDPRKNTSIGGSPAYMSPEQMRGDELTPASDWFGVGVSLYEVICGECPLDLRERSDANRSIADEIVAASDLSPQVANLIQRLLEPVESNRAGPDDVRLAFDLDKHGRVATPSTMGVFEAPFVGRKPELAQLHEAMQRVLRGSCTVVGISGESGIGKSALTSHALSSRISESFTILTSVCHQQESVPFKALDGIVDTLSNVIMGLPPGRRSKVNSLPRGALVRLFPVLDRVFADLPAPNAPLQAEPREIRDAGFSQLIDLFAVVAEVKPLAIWIDDLQWGDLDSATFLTRLAGAGLRAAIFLSFRPADAERAPLLQSLHEAKLFDQPNQYIRLTQLHEDEVSTLVASLLGDRHFTDFEKSIVASAGGSPFFACEFARHAQHLDVTGSSAHKFSQLLEARLNEMEQGSRKVLELLALTKGPCLRRVVERASDEANQARSTSALINARLITSIRSSSEELLEICHARIRSVIADQILDERKRALYYRLAEALDEEPDPDPLLAFEFYSGCEEKVLAADAAVKAARRAYDALAFDQAIRLYEESLELAPDALNRWQVLSDRALAYAQAGQSKEAGDSALQAAELLAAHPDKHTEYVHQITIAGEQLLRGGYLDDGLATLDLALRAVNLRYYQSPLHAGVSFIYHRAARRLLRRPAIVRATELPTKVRARIDACWAAAAGLAWVYPMHSAAHQANYLRLSLQGGEAQRLVRALSTEAVYVAGIYGHNSERLAGASIRDAKRICDGIDDVVAQGLIKVCETGSAFFAGKFAEAIPLGLDTERFLRSECTGVSWEITNVNLFTMVSMAHLGRFAELHERLPEIVTRASEQGNLLATCCLRTSYAQTLHLLAQDNPDGVRDSMAAARKDWRGEGFEVLHYYLACSETRLLLYQNRIQAAWDRLALTWKDFHWSQVAGFAVVKAEIVYLRARCALEMLKLTEKTVSDSQLRRVLRRCQRHLKRAPVDSAAVWLAAIEIEYRTLIDQPPTLASLEETTSLMRAGGFDLGAEMLRLRISQLCDLTEYAPVAGVANDRALARVV